MAVAVDGSTPGNVTQTNSAVANIVSGSFTPPAGSVLVVAWAGDSAAGVSPAAPSITDSLGAHLTYTLAGWASRADAGTVDGQAALWTAVVVTSAAMTITVTNGAASLREADLQVVVVTGANTAAPTGTIGKGNATSGSLSQSVLGTVAGSMAFVAWCDWQAATTTFTIGTGCTFVASAAVAAAINAACVRRTAADGTNGGSQTLSMSAPTSTAQQKVYVEIVPPGGAATAPPVLHMTAVGRAANF